MDKEGALQWTRWNVLHVCDYFGGGIPLPTIFEFAVIARRLTPPKEQGQVQGQHQEALFISTPIIQLQLTLNRRLYGDDPHVQQRPKLSSITNFQDSKDRSKWWQ